MNHQLLMHFFLKGFVHQVWILITLVSLLMGGLIYTFIHLLKAKPLSLLRSYWFIYGALLRQGSTYEPRPGNQVNVQ